MEKVNVFARYLSKAYKQKEKPLKNIPGPVITITRDFGCYAAEIAEKLVQKLNANSERVINSNEWHWLSKEIIEKSAEELKTKPEQIAHIFGAKEKGFFDDIASSFIRKYYVSDSNILTTIKTVIQTYAWEGFVVIVGRAAPMITKNIGNSLHIKIYAPLEYRIDLIAKRFGLSNRNAKKLVLETDKQRSDFMDFFRGSIPEYDFYDICLNRSKFSSERMVDIIYGLALERKLI